MRKLIQVFTSLRENKRDWLRISKGENLEDKLAIELKKIGFTRWNKKELAKKERTKWKKLKKEVQRKGKNELIINNFPSWTSESFVYSPYGSQNYPDFLVFTSKYIIPIELKASTKEGIKPMWNSHLPKSNSLYIFASYGKEDITFFRGSDVIEEELSKKLWDFFDRVKKVKEKFSKSLTKSERGWKPYIRVAFEQAETLLLPKNKLDYFQHPKRKEIEDKVFKWLETLS